MKCSTEPGLCEALHEGQLLSHVLGKRWVIHAGSAQGGCAEEGKERRKNLEVEGEHVMCIQTEDLACHTKGLRIYFPNRDH